MTAPYSPYFFKRAHKIERSNDLNHVEQGSAEDAGRDASEQEQGGAVIRQPHEFSYRKLRLLPSEKTLEEQLELLMENAERFGGNARENFLEQLLQFLQLNTDLVNKISKKANKRPLELVLEIGDLSMVAKLLKLNASVRKEYLPVLKQYEHRLFPERYPLRGMKMC